MGQPYSVQSDVVELHNPSFRVQVWSYRGSEETGRETSAPFLEEVQFDDTPLEEVLQWAQDKEGPLVDTAVYALVPVPFPEAVMVALKGKNPTVGPAAEVI